MTLTNEELYSAVAEAETSGESNPWIRTKEVPADGSTAYGPVQLTKGLATTFLDNRSGMFTKKEKSYLKKFLSQAAKFNKYGNNTNPDSPWFGIDNRGKAGYDDKFDYGGGGELTEVADKAAYKAVTQKMLRFYADKHDGNFTKALKDWRFGEASTKKRSNDKPYWKRAEGWIERNVGSEAPAADAAPFKEETAQFDAQEIFNTATQRQQEQANVAPAASQELSEGVTPIEEDSLTTEEQEVLALMEAEQSEAEAGLDSAIQREEEFLTAEEQMILQLMEEQANLGVEHQGPAASRASGDSKATEQDLIESIV